MNYDLVALEGKTIVGLCARTGNEEPSMGAVIGELWHRLFEQGIAQTLSHKSTGNFVGLYSDYEQGVQGLYDVTVGCEVDRAEAPLPDGLTVKVLPPSRYARFCLSGGSQETVGNFWSTLWQMDLPRSFTGDFEEYVPDQRGNVQNIVIYIALK